MSEYQVNITPRAEKSLLDIAEYIAQDNPIRAFTFIEEIYEFACNTFSVFPHSGKLYKNSFPNIEVRYMPYRDYIVVYSIDDEQESVEILLAFNAALDKDVILELFDDEWRIDWTIMRN